MFCGKCGNKNEADMKFCGKCGAQLGQGAAPSSGGEPLGTGALGVLDIGGLLKLDASDEDNATVTAAGVTIKAGLIFKIIPALLFVALLLPFFSFGVRIMGMTMADTMNGFTAIIGPEGVSGNFFAVFLLIIPILIFVMYQFNNALKFVTGKLFVFSTALCGLGFIMLFIVRSSLNSSFQPGFASGAAGFTISVILYILATIVSAGFLAATLKK